MGWVVGSRYGSGVASVKVEYRSLVPGSLFSLLPADLHPIAAGRVFLKAVSCGIARAEPPISHHLVQISGVIHDTGSETIRIGKVGAEIAAEWLARIEREPSTRENVLALRRTIRTFRRHPASPAGQHSIPTGL